jgi:hypothetical protein
MIVDFRLTVSNLGKTIVIRTMLGGKAFMEQYLMHNKISFFFHERLSFISTHTSKNCNKKWWPPNTIIIYPSSSHPLKTKLELSS